jgi:DNA-binding NtrC family response regulator
MACELVERALIDHRWNLTETARALGWSRLLLNRKMQRCGLARGSAPS